MPLAFILELLRNGFDRKLLRGLLKKNPQMDIFEACSRGEITPEEGAKLIQVRREPNCWLLRFIERPYK